MARYKLENALRGTEPHEFESDKQAWNTLRKTWKNEDGSIASIFIPLWKEVKVVVPINAEEHYVQEHNSFYGPKSVGGYGPDDAEIMEVGKPKIFEIWVPVLTGITSDEYNIK